MLPRNLGTAEDILIKKPPCRRGGGGGGGEKDAGEKTSHQPRQQKFRVILCLGDILQESLKAFPSRFHGELAAQLHDFDEFLFVIQPVVIAGAALGKGNGRINAPFGKFPVQADFQIARSLEFFKNHFVHS